MKIRVNEIKRGSWTDITDVLANPGGHEVVDMIEHLADETDPFLVRVRTLLIKELKREFGYDYVL